MSNIKLPVEMHESEYAMRVDSGEGMCIKCGETADFAEPDMHEGLCEHCEEHGVYGYEEMLIQGLLIFGGPDNVD
jgi:hypothetical protein